jgi:hypothetical protein
MTTAMVKRFARALACTTDYLIGMYEDEDEPAEDEEPAAAAVAD